MVSFYFPKPSNRDRPSQTTMASPHSRTGKTTYTGPRYNYKHPTLGPLTGRLVTLANFPTSPAVQFRSIPYAAVPKRFSPSQLCTSIPLEFDGRIHNDFTNYGAACPQLGAVNDAWADPYGGWLEDEKDIEFDEFTCLTLTISVPLFCLEELEKDCEQKVPVMIYVHGMCITFQRIAPSKQG